MWTSASLPWFQVPWLEIAQQTHSSPCIRAPAELTGGTMYCPVSGLNLSSGWPCSCLDELSNTAHFDENHFMLIGIKSFFFFFLMYFVALKHSAVKKYWKVLKDPPGVTECCEWDGGIWMLWKAFSEVCPFFCRQCKQSFNCLLVAYSSGNVTSSACIH